MLLTALLAMTAMATPASAAVCDGPAVRFVDLEPGLWLIPGSAGDADSRNRGHVTHLLLALDGERTWLIGSGPSPAFGRTLACRIEQHTGRRVSDVVSAWPRPESVLGVAGLGAARSWAHEDVAAAMAARCPSCVERLRERLGAAASDLGDDPVRVPAHHVRGDHGTLGPWRWWRLARADTAPVTVWQRAGSDLRFAPGLLWGSGVPDGRDADIATLDAATTALMRLSANEVPARWLGEQGDVLDAAGAARQAQYWTALQAEVTAAVARGVDESAPPPALPGWPAAASDPRHGLNWQRAWRQAEARWFQRNLR